MLFLPIFYIVASSSASNQHNERLSDYLAKHPWNATQRGPMLVVAPSETSSSSPDLSGLAAYGRKEMMSGGMTVIAPTEMVILDSRFKDRPNLYDGLPRNLKILYLCSTLSASQWKTAYSTGIGFADLRSEQQAVFQSILPSEFSYEDFSTTENGGLVHPPGEPKVVALNNDQRSQVRIRISDRVHLGVKVGNANGISGGVIPQNSDFVPTGQHTYIRKPQVEGEEDSVYGVRVRKVVANKVKPSDLDYASPKLDAPISLERSSIGDLCASVGRATGISIIPDSRIASLPVLLAGGSARSGDVLRALALAVTGTYRKVGNLYALTYDLDGIGSTWLRLLTWKRRVDLQVRQESQKWLAALANGEGDSFRRIPSSPSLPINDAMRDFIASDSGSTHVNTMPASRLSPEWQAFLHRKAIESSGTSHAISEEVVEPLVSSQWNFRMPDGHDLAWEDTISTWKELAKQKNGLPDYTSKSKIAPIDLSGGSSAVLFYRTDDPGLATALPAILERYGFTELFLQTSNEACLNSAINSAKGRNMKVRLVVEPWLAPQKSDRRGLDGTVLGQDYSKAISSVEGSNVWKNLAQIAGLTSAASHSVLTVRSDAVRASWEHIARLSGCAGLSGAVILESEPRGYEPMVSTSLHPVLSESAQLNLGYSTEARQEFLQKFRVDPIDIVDTRFRIPGLDQSDPFFMKDVKQFGLDTVESAQPDGALAAWLAYRSSANRTALSGLLKRLDLPILFQPRNHFQDQNPENGYPLVSWKTSEDLPTWSTDSRAEDTALRNPEEERYVWQLGSGNPATVDSRIFDLITRRRKKVKEAMGIDLRTVPAEELTRVLDRWFCARS